MNQLQQSVRKLNLEKHLTSNEILKQTMHIIKDFLKRQGGFTANAWESGLVQSLNVLITENPHLFALFHFVNSIFIHLQSQPSHLTTSTAIYDFVADYERKWQNANNEIIKHLQMEVDLNGKSILLHSNSAMIQQLFKTLAEKNISPTIYQTVSRPSNEGKQQAKFLASLGFTVKYVEEVAIGRFMPAIDIALLTADGILKNQFINKAGSLLIALACNQFNKPTYVLTDTRRRLNEDNCPAELLEKLTTEPQKPTEELWQFPPKEVTPINYFYDATPSELVTNYITEQGAISPVAMRHHTEDTVVSTLIMT